MTPAMPTSALVAAAAALSTLTGCASSMSDGHGGHVAMAELGQAIAVIVPTEGNSVRGTVTFVQTGSLMSVSADITGLVPNGEHAWHIHEFGDISAPDGTATGSHYNPEGHDHGVPPASERHAGDFGNLLADATGRAEKTIVVRNISIAGELNPIIGRGLIIHAQRDDGGQPTGNAGARIGQGVIGIRKGS